MLRKRSYSSTQIQLKEECGIEDMFLINLDSSRSQSPLEALMSINCCLE